MAHSLAKTALTTLVALLLAWAARASLDALVDQGPLFATPADAFEKAAGKRGEWLDSPSSRTLRLLRPTYLGHAIAEALVQFAPDGAPLRAQLLLYSRGDDGPSTGRDFVARLDPIRAHLDALANAPGVKRHVPTNSRLVELHSWEWSTPSALYRLDVASQGRASNLKGEFIRLWVLPPAAPAAPNPGRPVLPAPGDTRHTPAAASPDSADRDTRRDTLKKSDLLANVQRNGTAVTIAGVPMVAQGDKGYCAAATLARLLAYYGIGSIDQHELAAAMGTDAEGGTSTSAEKKTMADCGRKFGLRLAEIDELGYHDYERLVKEYNSAARKRGAPRIENRGGAPVVGGPFWQLADGPTLREARSGTPQKQRLWLKEARKYLDEGIPVVWGVYCGLLPERGATATRGGHLRLLIGYDESASLVYYTDTWGPGHECKPMPLADAITITRSRFVLHPKW